MAANETARTTVLVNNEEAKLALEELQNELKKIKQLRKEAFEKGDTAAFEMYDKEFKKVGQSANKLKKEIDAVENSLNDLNGLSLNQLKSSLNQAQGVLNKMSKTDPGFEAQKQKVLQLKSAYSELKAEMGDAGGFLGRLQSRLSLIPGPLGAMASGFASAAKAALAFIATPFGAVLTAIVGVGLAIKGLISNSKEFGKAASSLSAITGATGKDLDFLKKKAIELSKDSSQSATEMLGAFEKIGSAIPELLKNRPLLTEVTKNAVALSESTGGKLSIEDAAKAAAAALNQFNLPLTDSAKAVNVLAAGSLAGSAEINDLTESFKNVGAVASGAGMSLEQTVAALETLGEKSMYGTEAGTKLRGAILKLQDAGLGYASGSFNFRDALVEANSQINAQSTALEKDALAQKYFGAENITAGKILIENVDKYDQLTEAVTGTNSAFDMAKIQQDNLTTSNKKFGEAWKNVMLGIEDGGGIFTSVWKGIVDFGTNALNSIGETINSLKSNFKDLYDNSAIIRGAIQTIIVNFQIMFQTISVPFKEFFNSVGGLGKIMKAVFTGNFKDIPDIIKETFEKGKDIVVDSAKKIGTNIKEAWNETLNGKLEIPVKGLSPEEIEKQKKIAEEIEAAKAAETEKQRKKREADEKKAAKDAQDLAEAKANVAIAASEREYERKRMLIEENVSDEKEKNRQLEALEIAKSNDTIALLQKRLDTEKLSEVEQIKLKEEIEKEKFELEKKLSKQRIDQKKTDRETALKDLENQEQAELNIIKKQLADGIIAEDVAEQLLLQKEIEFLNRKIALKKQYGEDTADLEGQVFDKTLKIAENAAKGQADQEKALAEIRQKYADEEVVRKQELAAELAELDAVTKNGQLVSQEEYEKLKSAIHEKYEKNRYETTQKYLEGASNILGILSNLNNAAKDRELKKAGDNAAKKEAIEKKYAKKSQKIAIAQAVVNGALAVTKILAETPKADFGIMTAILIAGAIATTAAEVAAISNQQFKTGGYTSPSASDSTPVGVVHANEWVASAPLLRNPETRRHIDYLEAVQRNISPRFNTAAISSASRGFQAGGFSPESGTSTTQTVVMQQSDPALLAVMQQNAELLAHLKQNGVKSNINTREIFKAENDFQSTIIASEY